MQYHFDREAHLHTLDGRALTGTTSIIGVLNTPLAYYASGKACEVFGASDYHLFGKMSKGEANEAEIASFELSANAMLKKIKEMKVGEYMKLLDKAYRAHDKESHKKADAGKDLHSLLESFVKSEMGKKKLPDSDFKDIEQYVAWSRKNVKQYLASEANCYSERLWVGGQLDAAAIMNDESQAIIDFKSRDKAYPKDLLQTSGYALQVEENGFFSEDGKANKKVAQPFTKVIIVPMGMKKLEPIENTNILELKKGFESAVFLYQLLGLHK